MAAAAILKSVKRNNSAIFERICTKFGTDTENNVPRQLLPSELVSDEIQDGDGRHIENHIFGQPLLHAFAPNLKHRLKMWSNSQT